MLGFGGLHITIRIFFWIWTFRSANLSNCKFFSANYSKGKISDAVHVRCFPAFSLKRANSYICVFEARRTLTTARTPSENIILRFCNHFFVTCSRCPQKSFDVVNMTDVQKWNTHVNACNFFNNVSAISYSCTCQKWSWLLLPPRFYLTTCSSLLPFSFVGRNKFTWQHFRDAKLVGWAVI